MYVRDNFVRKKLGLLMQLTSSLLLRDPNIILWGLLFPYSLNDITLPPPLPRTRDSRDS